MVKVPQKNSSNNDARLIVPAWWVRAFDAASRRSGDLSGSLAQGAAGGLAPALSTSELSTLAVILTSLQRQGDGSGWRLDPAVESRHANVTQRRGKLKGERIERVIQQLAGLRLARTHAEGTRFTRIFSGDEWVTPPSGNNIGVSLFPGPLSREALFGLYDAHADLERAARGEAEARYILGGRAPLSLWRSVWLELLGVEQALYLRLEGAMQWEFRWLSLEGAFGVGVTELFEGLEVPPEFLKQAHLLQRFGRRLSAHGFLKPVAFESVIADSSELTLVGQACQERLSHEELLRHRTQFMAQCDSAMPMPAALIRLCVAEDVPDAVSSAAQQLWSELLECDADTSSHFVCADDGAALWSARTLFFELALRRRFASGLPVPELLKSGLMGELLSGDGSRGAKAAYAAFVAALNDDRSALDALATTQFATFASRATRETQELSRALAGAAQKPSQQKLTTSPKSASQAAEKSPRQLAPLKTTDAPKEPLKSRMRRVADEELLNMRRGDPERYRDLKRAYLESLDESARRLILDVQSRMQPTMFEEHLRQRLVRYMVENPGGWRSVQAVRPSPRA